MYHGGESVYDTCFVCITIERCIAYAGHHARRRTLDEWDNVFNSCHEHSHDFLTEFYGDVSITLAKYFFIIQMSGKPQWNIIMSQLTEIRQCNDILRNLDSRRSPNHERLMKYIICSLTLSIKWFHYSSTTNIIHLVDCKNFVLFQFLRGPIHSIDFYHGRYIEIHQGSGSLFIPRTFFFWIHDDEGIQFIPTFFPFHFLVGGCT